LPISSDLIEIELELIGKGGQAMNEKRRVEDMSRAELIAEAATYGWVVNNREDTDGDLMSVVIAGREGARWHAKAA
jgi:hypothetical protein